MRSPIGSYQAEMAKINQTKYACQPSWDLVQEYLDQFKMSLYHFERFFGIPYNTLTQVKHKKRTFPQYAWHFIYEKKKPRYGVGFVIDNIEKQELKERVKKARKNKAKKTTAPEIVTIDSHSRLLDIK